MNDNYRLTIDKLENGFTTRRDSENPQSKVFVTLEDLIEYVRDYFEGNKK